LSSLLAKILSVFRQSKPSFVRIYRDYVVGDFVFGTLFAAIGSYAAFRPIVRSNVCELLSRQPDILRDFIDLGLTVENCEPWFERGVFGFMVILIIITVIRVSKFRLDGCVARRKAEGVIIAASFRVGFVKLL
jgi:hypothetical protein